MPQRSELAVADNQLLMPTFVAMADTLVDDFDLMDLLSLLTDRCVEIFGVSAAGIMLAGPDGRLRLAASSSEVMRTLEIFELQASEGPCLDCFRTGHAVENQSLASAPQWPGFAPEAMRVGFASAVALPLRLRREVLGALNLFGAQPVAVAPSDLVAMQALADVATIAIVQYRAAIDAKTLNDQLTAALQSRVLIEQAKGVLAERLGADVGVAFDAMRRFARRRGLHLTEVAQGVVAGTVDVTVDR